MIKKRLMIFYTIGCKYKVLYPKKYAMVCTRSWWGCFKLGMRHIRKGRAFFFTIRKKPKKS